MKLSRYMQMMIEESQKHLVLPPAADLKQASDDEFDASEIPNTPITEVRCGLGQRKRVRELLYEWADSLDPSARVVAAALLDLPTLEKDSYPKNRFTLCDEHGETVFVGHIGKKALDIKPPPE